MRNDAVGQIENMGSNLLFVFPAKMDGMNNAPAKRFTMNDYEYLKSRLPGAGDRRRHLPGEHDRQGGQQDVARR